MTIDWNLVAVVAMPIVTLFLGALLNHLVESRPNLITHLGFISSHRLEPQQNGIPGPIVNAHSVILKNTGRKVATNVRLGHNFLPNINVYPDIEYKIRDLPGGQKEILFPTLVPKKEISINYLYFAPDTWERINTHIESDDGPAKVVNVLLQTQLKPWLLKVLWIFIVIGVITCSYFFVEVIRRLAT